MRSLAASRAPWRSLAAALPPLAPPGARSSRLAPLALGTFLAILFPRPGHGSSADPPTVALDGMRVEADGVVARTRDGSTATLTLDPGLQRAAQRLLAQARPREGAVVAVDPKTGRVLAWAGVRGGSPDPGVATGTLAPAASLFKIVTTTALLEKKVPVDRTVCIHGGSSVIREEHLRRPREGQALCGPFGDALGRSRNAVFAQLATRFLRREDLEEVGTRLGFGQNVPSDVSGPLGTLEVPDGDLPLARAAAGFVGSRLSPLGAAYLATTVAAGGRMLRLRLVDHVAEYEAPRRAEVVSRGMGEATARELVHMMEVTVHSGTSREVFTDPEGRNYLGDIRAAGKTGTLQAGADEPLTSWFVGFAPSRKPRVVVSVLLENGVGWRRKANEVGRDVLRAYFAARGSRGVTAPDGL